MNPTNRLELCSACETPFETGEDVCSTCGEMLPGAESSDSGRREPQARKRREKVVDAGTLSIYIGCLVGVTGIQTVLRFTTGLGDYRDLTGVVPLVLIVIGARIVYGYPGTTLHHYPTNALVRRGNPEWWKGLSASALFVGFAIVLCEFFNRPILQERGRNSRDISSVEVESTILVWNLVVYTAVAIILLWNFLVHLVGPQNMGMTRRKQLLSAQSAATVRRGA